MKGHVQLLGILMMVQGALECGAAVVYAVIPGDAPGAGRALELFLFAGIPLAILAAGVLRIVAAVLTLSYRARRLGLVSLFAGLASAVTCFCLPPSIALFGYGLWVYTRPPVRRAFERRAARASREEIEAALAGGTPGVPG